MNRDEFEAFVGEDGAAEFMSVVYADVYEIYLSIWSHCYHSFLDTFCWWRISSECLLGKEMYAPFYYIERERVWL